MALSKVRVTLEGGKIKREPKRQILHLGRNRMAYEQKVGENKTKQMGGVKGTRSK